MAHWVTLIMKSHLTIMEKQLKIAIEIGDRALERGALWKCRYLLTTSLGF